MIAMTAKAAKRLTMACLALGAGGLAIWLICSGSNISESNFKRLHDGMTLAEAEEVVGQPSVADEALTTLAGNQLANRWGKHIIPRRFRSLDSDAAEKLGCQLRVWSGTGRSITVVLDKEGKVRGAGFWMDNPQVWWRQVHLMLGL